MCFLSVKAIKESNATMCIQLIRIGPAEGEIKDTSSISTQVKTSKAIRGPSAYGLFARSQQRCEQVRTCELEYIPYHRFVHMLKLIINFFSHFHFFFYVKVFCMILCRYTS